MCDVSSTVGLTRCYKTEGFYAFIIVTWWSGPGGIRALRARPTGFFSALTLLIWLYDL